MRIRSIWSLAFLITFFFISLQLSNAQPEWHGKLGLGTDDNVSDMIRTPDGDILVAGEFTAAGPQAASGLARWDGDQWHAVADFDGDVSTLAIHGDNLYVGGNFTSVTPPGESEISAEQVAMKNLLTGEWEAMGIGLSNGAVRAMEVTDNGTVYAGGCFRQSGQQSLDRVAIWNGDTWNPLKAGTENQNGVNGCVNGLLYDNDNNRLYLGGAFTSAINYNNQDDSNESITLGRVTYYDGRWRQIGGGISSNFPGLPNPGVHTLLLHDGDLYVGGLLWEAYNDPGDIGDSDAAVDVRRAARWDGNQWHKVFDESGGSVNEIVADGDILHIGGSFETVGAPGQDRFYAQGYVRYDTETGAFVTDGEGNSPTGAGFTYGGSSESTLRSTGTVRSIIFDGSDIYTGGTFDRIEIEDDFTEHRRIVNTARWDGDTWHTMGTGTSNEITDVAALGDTLFIAGEFHHVTHNGETFPSPHAAVFDRSAGSFIPSATNIALKDESMGYQVTVDQATGQAFMAGGTASLVDQAGNSEAANVLTWNTAQQQWDALGRLSQSGTQNARITDMLVANRHLYITGRFDNLYGVSHSDNVGSLIRYDLDEETFEFPELEGMISSSYHVGYAMTADDNCLYALFWVNQNFRHLPSGNIMCLDLETDETRFFDGYANFGSPGFTYVDLLKEGEHLYVAGNGGSVAFYDDGGDTEEWVDLSSNIIILHPESENWFAWPGDFNSYARSIFKAGNSLYIAGHITQVGGVNTDDYDGIARFDMGSGEWNRVGETDGREVRLGIAEIDDHLWTWGEFRTSGNTGGEFLASYPEIDDGTPGPVAGINKREISLALHQDQPFEMPFYLPNLGDAALDWELSIETIGVPDNGGATNGGWIETQTLSSSADPHSADSVILEMDPSGLASGIHEATLTISTNDAVGTEFEVPVSLTVNPLTAATDPYPANGASNITSGTWFGWENQRFPDKVTVYLSTTESFTEDDIVYEGAAIDSLSASDIAGQLGEPLEGFETYFWRVNQANSADEAEGETWKFRTAPGDNDIAIGDMEWGVDYYPIYPSQNPTWIQTLFPQSQINRSGDIATLAYHYLGEADAVQDVQIYMGTMEADAYSDSDSWLPVSEMTLVYDGPMEMEERESSYWLELELNEPFTYDNNENLVIGVFNEDDRDISDVVANIRFYSTGQDDDLSMFWYGEEDVNPSDAPGNGYTWSELPDIRFTFGVDDDPVVPDPPATPVLVTPQDEADGLDFESLTLEWEMPEEADSVRLEVNLDEEVTQSDISDDSHAADLWLDAESYTLENLNENSTYSWRMRSVSDGGESDWSETWSFTTRQATAVAEAPDVPESHELHQNYPNPFNPDTQIKYGLPSDGHVRVTVYNAIGQRVVTLVDEQQSAGWHTVRFDGGQLSSGLYIYEMVSGSHQETRGMMLVK